MDNTRHERAITVLTSYVIGFVSAFIAFGISGSEPVNNIAITAATHQSAVTETVSYPHSPASLSIEEEGLVLLLEGETRLLTARKSSPLLASVITAEAQSGMAVRLTEAELSRDGKFVYFCEQLTDSAENCDAYVYSVANNVLHPVTVNGEVYKPINSTHQSSWTADGRLFLDGYTSNYADTPWLLQ